MTSLARAAQNGHLRRPLSAALLSAYSRPLAFSISRQIQRQPKLLAVYSQHQHSPYSTETPTTSGSSSSFPPPGFNAERAKKPVPKSPSEHSEQVSKEADAIAAATQEIRDELTNTTKPTGEAKTKAQADMSLTELAASKAKGAATTKSNENKAAKGQKKLTVWQKVKKELHHYWDGTKLLATEVKISSRLALKMAAGYELSRRENRQLRRTVQDLGRIVPFSVFVIVPFAELLLPVALRLFPNLLPSTYEGQKSKDSKATHLRTTRKEVSNFLQETLRETGLPMPTNISATAGKKEREEFAEFFRKVRATGENPSQDEVIKVCKTFKDDLTLDNLSRPQLVGMCRYMNLNSFGTDMMLRYHIRHRMRQIKRDDRAISYEGVESLSVPELQMACAARGLRTHGMSPGHLRDDLQMWLDLRLKYGLPSTLLVLSNAFLYAQGKDSQMESQIDALQAVLSSIPEELFHEIELEVHNAEGAATNKQRLEVLKEQQDLIEEENEQQEQSSGGSDDEDNSSAASRSGAGEDNGAGDGRDNGDEASRKASQASRKAPPKDDANIDEEHGAKQWREPSQQRQRKEAEEAEQFEQEQQSMTKKE